MPQNMVSGVIMHVTLVTIKWWSAIIVHFKRILNHFAPKIGVWIRHVYCKASPLGSIVTIHVSNANSMLNFSNEQKHCSLYSIIVKCIFTSGKIVGGEQLKEKDTQYNKPLHPKVGVSLKTCMLRIHPN